METATLTIEQVRLLRLVRLGLAPQAPGAPTLRTAADVVGHHLAMQGQDQAALRWAIASRLTAHDPTPASIDAAFENEIVRTWPMRGTVHALTLADSRWLLDLCGPVALRAAPYRRTQLGLDQTFADTVERVAREHLSQHRSASRDELIAAFTAAGLDFTDSARRYHAIWYACQLGIGLLGPVRDGENRLVLADTHAPHAIRYTSPDAALPQLGPRYLAARGPASVADLQHWTKLTKTQVRRALGEVPDLVRVAVVSHEDLFAPAGQLNHLTDLAFGQNVPRALVLAGFDEHLLGYRDRSAVLDPSKVRYVDPARNGVFRHTVVLDGRVVGTWQRRLLTTTAPVQVSLFERVGARERKLLVRAFEPWGRYVGLEPVVTFADV